MRDGGGAPSADFIGPYLVLGGVLFVALDFSVGASECFFGGIDVGILQVEGDRCGGFVEVMEPFRHDLESVVWVVGG